LRKDISLSPTCAARAVKTPPPPPPPLHSTPGPGGLIISICICIFLSAFIHHGVAGSLTSPLIECSRSVIPLSTATGLTQRRVL